MVDNYRDKLDAGEVVTELAESKPDATAVDWSKYLSGKLSDKTDTRVPRKKLDALAQAINTIPAEIVLHPRVAKIYLHNLSAKNKCRALFKASQSSRQSGLEGLIASALVLRILLRL